jgi:signal transduction protein with GAF and PtsI domain
VAGEPHPKDEPPPGALGAEEEAGDGSSPVIEPVPAGSLDLRRMAAIPASHNVVDGALRLVVALAAATVGGADGVSVSLERRGELTTVASSDETILQMDRDQYATGQGPCVAAAREGHWFHVESLDEEDRWPDFIPRAIEGGIHSILSSPLLADARPVGALNIYSNRNRAFGTAEQELAALFATQASGILEDAGAHVPDDDIAAQLEDALRSREVIAQAQGVLMARGRLSANEASAQLRRTARDAEMTVRRVAEETVASTADPGPPS